MISFFKKILSHILWLCILLGCIIVIGYYFYPNLVEKYQEVCHESSPMCDKKHFTASQPPRADVFQETIEKKTLGFFGLFLEAARELLSDTSGKKSVTYTLDGEKETYVSGK